MRQVEFRVERYKETIIERERGYLPIEKTIECQRLVRLTPIFFGRMTAREVIDYEIIPDHVMITLGCTGDTGGWRSKFASYINGEQPSTEQKSSLYN